MSLNDEPYPPLSKLKLSAWMHHHAYKLLILTLWLLAIGVYWWISDYYNLSPKQKIIGLADWFVNSLYGPPLFIIFFALQPLVFFPSFLLGIAGGVLYGPVEGAIYVLFGANGAANVCYVVGRFFGRGFLEGNKKSESLIHRYAERLRNNTFETILIMQLLVVVPFDIVNYIAGFLRMRWRYFALATLFGAVPGVFTFVLFGHSLGSIDNIVTGTPQIDFSMLALSGVMLIAGLSLSQLIRRWEKRAEHGD